MFKLSFMLVFLSVALVSCKKDYICSCVQTSTTTAYTQYGTFHPQKTDAQTFKNTYRNTEEKATSSCKQIESLSANTYGSGESQRTITTQTSCELY